MVVLGGWLDFMILEVFSNLNDSMIFLKSYAGQFKQLKIFSMDSCAVMLTL